VGWQFFPVYLFICIQVEEVKIPIPQHSKMLIYLCLHVEEGNPLPIPQHSKLFIYLYGHLYNNKLHIMSWMILYKKQLFDLEVKSQGPTKVITVRNTSSYGHAPTPTTQ
jgi:hypothetical protein